MSYTELFFMDKNKNIIEKAKIKNAHRGARFIWEQLITLYLDNISLRKLAEKDELDKLWDLVKDKRLNKNERICLLYTLDYALIDRKNYKELVSALRSMHLSKEYDSLFEQAFVIENLFNENEKIEYLGVNQNSVSCDFWENEEDKEKAWLVFEEEYINISIEDKIRKIIDRHNKAIVKLIKIKKELIIANYEIDIKPIDFEYMINRMDIEIQAIKLRRDFLAKPNIETGEKNEEL